MPGPRIGSSRAPPSVRCLASSFGTLEIVKAASSVLSSSIAMVRGTVASTSCTSPGEKYPCSTI